MTNPWRDHIVITTDQAQIYLQEQYPDFKILNITYLDQGWDNILFLINNYLILRFAKTEETAPWLQQENNVLPKIYRLLPLPIPNPIIIGKPTRNNPFFFQGYEKIPGIPAYQVHMQDTHQENVTKQIALFLKKLHSINSKQALTLGALPVVYDRTNLDKVADSLQHRFHQLIQLNIFDFDTNLVERQLNIATQINLPQIKTLILGDLDFRHILINEQSISGIIDWGDVGIGHPVTDLALVYLWIPTEFHPIFFKHYGDIPTSMQKYAQLLALNRSVTLIWYAHNIQNKQLLLTAKFAFNLLCNS